MKITLICMIGLLFIACQSPHTSVDEENNIDASKTSLDEMPATIQDFFAIESTFFDTTDCLDKNAILNLILSDQKESGWNEYDYQDFGLEGVGLLSLINSECGISLEFDSYKTNDFGFAVLHQTKEDREAIQFFQLDTVSNQWIICNDLPNPTPTNYFEILSPAEKILVNEHAQYTYLLTGFNTIGILFDDYVFTEKVNAESGLLFESKADYYFSIDFSSTELKTEWISLEEDY